MTKVWSSQNDNFSISNQLDLKYKNNGKEIERNKLKNKIDQLEKDIKEVKNLILKLNK